jgi:hypothetical protein
MIIGVVGFGFQPFSPRNVRSCPAARGAVHGYHDNPAARGVSTDGTPSDLP